MGYTTHGLRALKDRVRIKSVEVSVDKRSSGWKALVAFKANLLASLGGEDQLSAMEIVLLDEICRVKLFIDHCDVYLLGLDDVLSGRGKQRVFVPIMKERMVLSGRLESLLGKLGMKKREIVVTDLKSYIGNNYDDNYDPTTKPPSTMPLEPSSTTSSTPSPTTQSEATSKAF